MWSFEVTLFTGTILVTTLGLPIIFRVVSTMVTLLTFKYKHLVVMHGA